METGKMSRKKLYPYSENNLKVFLTYIKNLNGLVENVK